MLAYLAVLQVYMAYGYVNSPPSTLTYSPHSAGVYSMIGSVARLDTISNSATVASSDHIQYI